MKTSVEPFAIRRENGIVWIDAAVDAAFRKALLDGVPISLRAKMRDALSATPSADSMEHSVRYFGDELESIKMQVKPLIFELNKLLSSRFALPGLYVWLNATNFGNEYRMIKVFRAWSEITVSSRGENKDADRRDKLGHDVEISGSGVSILANG